MNICGGLLARISDYRLREPGVEFKLRRDRFLYGIPVPSVVWLGTWL